MKTNGRQRTTGYNSKLAMGGVSSPFDSFVVEESSVLRTNFCAEKPPIANLQNVMPHFKRQTKSSNPIRQQNDNDKKRLFQNFN